MNSPPSRAPALTSADDTILPFAVEGLDLRGRVVRLGAAVDDILRRHDYPLPISKLLGEAITLGAMLGSALKLDGRFIMQTQSDGPVKMMVVDFVTPDRIRACARFDRDALSAVSEAGEPSSGDLLGRGHLAMTIDQGPTTNRYQGLVALEGEGLEAAAHEYFQRSEQIPTRVKLAVAEEVSAGEDGPRHRWRAGGIMLQFLPKSPDRLRSADLDPGDAPPGLAPHIVPEDEAWLEGRSMIESVEDIELVDPSLSSEQLLYRLFHERGVRVFRDGRVHAQCSCSRHRVEQMLRGFPRSDRDDMVQNGVVEVVCEFCNATYRFDPQELESA